MMAAQQDSLHQLNHMKSLTVLGLLSIFVFCVPTHAENESPSNDQQIVDAAEPLWGKAVNGLQAGLVIGVHKDSDAIRRFMGYKRLPDLIECALNGEEVMAEIAVRNIADHKISFAKTGGRFPSATATDPQGTTQQLDSIHPVRRAFSDRRTLAAGEQCYFKASHFHLVLGEYDWANRNSAPLRVEQNVPYKVVYDFTIEPHNELWSGTLTTGSLTVVYPDRKPKNGIVVPSLPKPKPASPEGKRTVLWGEARDGFQAGILVVGTHTVQRHQIELGQEFSSQIVVRNVSKAPKTIRWRQNQWRRGGWHVIDATGETTGAHDSWRRSWELRNKDDLITIPPGREIVFYGGSFAVTEHDGRDWVVPSANAGTGNFDAKFGIGLRLDTNPEQSVYVTSGNLPIRVTERTPHRLVGRRAENFQLALDGEQYELAHSRDKEVVVLVFWGAGDYSSHQRARTIPWLQHELKEMPVRVLGITDDSGEAARKWLRENEVSLIPALDFDGVVKHTFNIPGETFPKSIIIGKDGVIKEAFQFDGYPHRIRDFVKTIL